MEGLGYQMCLGMWDRGMDGGWWGMPWRDRQGMAAEQGIGKGGNRGGAESQACRVAAKPTVMLATGIGCCGPQVVLVRTSKGQLWTWKHNSFPPVYPVICLYDTTFRFLLLSGFLFVFFPWEVHRRCCRIFELRRSDSMPAGLPRHTARKTYERKVRDRSEEERWAAVWETHDVFLCSKRWQNVSTMFSTEQTTQGNHT